MIDPPPAFEQAGEERPHPAYLIVNTTNSGPNYTTSRDVTHVTQFTAESRPDSPRGATP